MRRFLVKAAVFAVSVVLAFSSCDTGLDKSDSVTPALALFYEIEGEAVNCTNGPLEVVKGEEGVLVAALTGGIAKVSSFKWECAEGGEQFVSLSTGAAVTMQAILAGLENTATEAAIRISAEIQGKNGAKTRVYTDVSVFPVRPLKSVSILRGGEEVSGTEISLDQMQPVKLTAAALPVSAPFSLTWASDNEEAASVNGSGIVTGVATGSAVITVFASNEASSVSAQVTVVVSDKVYVKDPVIWEWNFARDGGILEGVLNNSTNTARIGGTGLYTDVPIKVSNENQSAAISFDDTGIIIDGTASKASFLVGSNGKALSTAETCPGGIFDLATDNVFGIQVTVDADILTDGGSSKSFAVYLNNSTTTNANTPLRNGDNKARIIYYQTPKAAGTLNSPGANGVWTPDSGTHGTFTSRVFLPDDFNQTYIDTLGKAFLGFAVLSGGPKIRINGVRIEYMDASYTPPEPEPPVAEADPKRIWEWDYAKGGGLTDGQLSGYDSDGNEKLVSVAKLLNTARITEGTGGIQIDGSTSDTTSCVLAVGTSSTSASTSSNSPAGEFDFRTGNTDGILVTLKIEILTEGGDRGLGVILNNSTSTSANTPLTTSSTAQEARIYYQHPAANATLPDTGYWDSITGTVTCKVFKPGDLNQSNITYLEKAYLGIVVWSTREGVQGSKVLIKGIRIEYVDASYEAPKPPEITSVSITKDGSAVTTLELAAGASAQLAASVLPAGNQASLAWVSASPAVATVDSTGKVTGVTSGSAVITVTASNSAPSTQTASLTVTVTEAAAVDPNLIWEWSYARDGGVLSGTLDSSTNTARIGGTGLYTDVPIKISGSTTSAKVSTDSTGIIIDGTSAAASFLVGANGKTASTDKNCPGGIFNFATNNTNGIQVTVDADILTDGADSKSFAVYLNNSTTTNANTPLRNGDNKARIIYYQTPKAAGTLNSPDANGVWTPDSGTHGTFTSRVFLPDDFNQTYIDTLGTAFLGFAVLSGGPKIRINGIRIEYVE